MLNGRSRNILLEIILHRLVRPKDLAGKFRVSERTIRMDLDDINFFLKQNRYPVLQNRGKQGVYFPGSKEETAGLYRLMNTKEIVMASYLPDERLLEILYTVACRKGPVKIEELAEQLLVSKSTVVKDLERLKLMYQTDFLRLQGTAVGIELIGDEAKIRRSIVNAFVYHMDKNAVRDVLKLFVSRGDPVTYRVYWRLFEVVDLDFVIECADMVESRLSVRLSDTKYLLLCGYLCMTIKRIGMGCPAGDGAYDPAGSKTGQLAKELGQMLQKQCEVPVTGGELEFLRYILYSISYQSYLADHPVDEKEVAIIIQFMIDNVSASGYPCLQNDRLLKSGLKEEILELVVKRELNLPVSKNIISLKDQMYFDMYNLVEKSVFPLRAYMKRSLVENEVWRLTYHFIDGCLRHTAGSGKRVLIVSDKAKPLIRILENRLLSMFRVDIAASVGFRQMDRALQCYKPDCVVATMQIEVPGVETLTVHPLLSDKDIRKLTTHLPGHVLDYEMIDRILDCLDIAGDSAARDEAGEKLAAMFKLKTDWITGSEKE